MLVESVHGDGATFIALIPRPDRRALYEAYSRTSSSPQIPSSRTVRQRALIVDSDEHVLRAVARVLDEHYDVLLAHDEQEAIELMSSGSQVDLVVADASPPDFAGTALLRWLRASGSPLARRTILVTPQDDSSDEPPTSVDCRVLRKPISRGALLTILAQLDPGCENASSA